MDNNAVDYKIVFIIAHRYTRGYKSYLKYYINNILSFYKNPLIIVVDNNSKYKDDIFDDIKSRDNVILLDNYIKCKFELGAYQVGFRYLLDNNLVNDYDYVVCTQDNFINKNKLNFNNLYKNKITACTINSHVQDWIGSEITKKVLTNLGLYDNLDKITFCWCNSFIIHSCKLYQLYYYLRQIVITARLESEASERYMARILWELNEHKNNDIDGNLGDIGHYDSYSVDVTAPAKTFFIKRTEGKTEKTQDI